MWNGIGSTTDGRTLARRWRLRVSRSRPRSRSFGAVSALAVAIGWIAVPGLAQQGGGPSAAPLKLVVHSVDDQQKSVELPLDRAIRMRVGKSVIVELAEPASERGGGIDSVSIGAKEIAEATVIFDTQVQINAKKAGTTRVTVWTKDRRHRMLDVDVEAGAVSHATEQAMREGVRRLEDELQAQIKRAYPKAEVRIQFLHDNKYNPRKVLLSGVVQTAVMSQTIEQIAEAFMASADTEEPAAPGDVSSPSGAPGAAGTPAPSGQAVATTGGKSDDKRVINNMTVAGEHQILLRCTVAEVSKRAIRELSVNGWLAGDNIRDFFAVNQIAGINPVNIGAAGAQNIIQPNGLVFATDVDGLNLSTTSNFSIGFPRVQLQLFFQAMRENDLLRVLAEPNLVAVAGEEAAFLAGGEFPVPEPQSSGTGGVTITIKYKKFGIQMAFVGTPIGRDMIRLRVMPEVSDLDPSSSIPIPGTGLSVPGLTVRRAETTIELASGSTIAIAGLLSEAVRGASQKLPGLGDVPVLGALFSSNRYQRSQTELVILVTPELVVGMNPDQVGPVPGQYMTEPNDFQLFGLGLLEGDPAPDPDDREQAVRTDVPSRVRKWSAPPTQRTLHGPWGPAEEGEVK